MVAVCTGTSRQQRAVKQVGIKYARGTEGLFNWLSVLQGEDECTSSDVENAHHTCSLEQPMYHQFNGC